MKIPDWIKELKAGDKVDVCFRYSDPHIGVVKKITPTGIIKVTHNDGRLETAFNPHGDKRGSDGGYYSCFIAKHIPREWEIRKKRGKIRSLLSKCKERKIDLPDNEETLDKMIKSLNDFVELANIRDPHD